MEADITHREGYMTAARHVRAFGVVNCCGFDMTGTTISSDGLDNRRKRLLFRCWHRGTREMDLIIGRFADAHLADLSDAELTELEQLIELPDPDLYAALTGAGDIPPAMARGVFERMRTFRAWEAGR
jgi:antitoxin CptB